MSLALDHVQIAIPRDGEERARAFFGGLLGLAELAKPDELAGRGGCWFALGAQQLHCGVDPDFRAAKKAHVALALAALADLRERLAAAGVAIRDEVPLEGRARFFCDDPFGNRLEFIERR